MPYNPQQNEVAKRKNKTICEVVKAILCDVDLLLSLWVEAASTVVYIQNRRPHAILGEHTPKEMFTGTKPAIDHKRIFASPVYIYVPKEKRTKLEPSEIER